MGGKTTTSLPVAGIKPDPSPRRGFFFYTAPTARDAVHQFASKKGDSDSATGSKSNTTNHEIGHISFIGSSTKPLPYGYKYYVLLETLGNYHLRDYNLLEELLGDAFAQELINDATLAQSQQHLDFFWKIREDVDVLVDNCNHVQNFDVSLPLKDIGNYVDQVFVALDKVHEVEVYFAHGHVADGNIHFLAGKTNGSVELTNKINDIIYEPLKDLNGSISAEHGIGLHKKKYLEFCRSTEEIDLMRLLKTSLDSNGILNRGVIIDT